MKFYWFDSLNEFDKSITDGVHRLLETVYAPLANKMGLDFKFIETSELLVCSGEEDKVIHHGLNLLENQAGVYISYTNPSTQIEKMHESLALIADRNTNWKIANKVPKGLFLDKDKLVGIEFARKVGAPVIPTILIPGKSSYRTLLPVIEEQLGEFPYLIKPKDMLAGLGIVKVESREKLKSTLDIIVQSNKDYLIQPFLEEASDYRVYTNNGAVISCLKRMPSKGDYLASISQSGLGTNTTTPEEIKKHSEDIAKILGGGYICIDWLATSNDSKFYFSEFESGGGFTGLKEPDRSKVATAFFESVL